MHRQRRTQKQLLSFSCLFVRLTPASGNRVAPSNPEMLPWANWIHWNRGAITFQRQLRFHDQGRHDERYFRFRSTSARIATAAAANRSNQIECRGGLTWFGWRNKYTFWAAAPEGSMTYYSTKGNFSDPAVSSLSPPLKPQIRPFSPQTRPLRLQIKPLTLYQASQTLNKTALTSK